jgi:hypothetical protein
MSSTVYANGNGLFHSGSDGKGIAFPDVCLSPPPPPTGPVPVPYTNKDAASDLSDGSQSVQIEGNPTALKDKSCMSTSSGDEGGTQGGNVVTHKTQGKGYFKFWSFDVKIEGLNVDCHTDPQGQNCASDPPGGLCLRSKVVKDTVARAKSPLTPCTRKFTRADRHGTPDDDQTAAVQKGPCWQCPKGTTGNGPFIADHQPPLIVYFYAGGCNSDAKMKAYAKSKKTIKPHCAKHSASQGGSMSHFSKVLRGIAGL